MTSVIFLSKININIKKFSFMRYKSSVQISNWGVQRIKFPTFESIKGC